MIKLEKKSFLSLISNAYKQKSKVLQQKNNLMSTGQSSLSFTTSTEIWNMWSNLTIKTTRLELLHMTILNNLVFQRKNLTSNVKSFLEKFQLFFNQEKVAISTS